MGMTAYLRNSGLGGTRLFDAQGNHFDRAVIGIRAGPHLQVWAAGGELPPVSYTHLRAHETRRHL
eukprot:10459240-Prorocentrum_lima.AAC.1